MSPPDRKVVHDTVNEIDGRPHDLGGRGPAPPGRDHPRRLIRLAADRARGGPGLHQPRLPSSSAPAGLAFSGPGRSAVHVEHAEAFLAALEGSTGRWSTSAAAAVCRG